MAAGGGVGVAGGFVSIVRRWCRLPGDTTGNTLVVCAACTTARMAVEPLPFSVQSEHNIVVLLSRSEKRQIFRKQLWSVLHYGRGATGHAFYFFLIILIIVSVAIIPLELFLPVGQLIDIIHSIEAVIIGCFTVEYLLRIYSAPKRLQYMFSFFGLVDLVSIIPFYAGIFGSQYILALRLVRLLKLAEIRAAAEQDEIDVMQHDIGLAPGETVEYVVTKSPIVLLIGIVPPIVAFTFGLGALLYIEGIVGISVAVALFLFALILLWRGWLDYSYDVLYITNYRLIFQDQHLLGRGINQVSYPSVTNVKPMYPSAISYILRFGSLVIDTAAEHPGQIQLHMVRRHEKAAHLIMHKCLEAQARGSAHMTPIMGGTTGGR